MKNRRTLLMAGIVCLFLALALCPAYGKESGKTVKWIWGEYESVTKGASWEMTEWFTKELTKRSNGRFQFDVHWGDLGGDKELLGLAKSGVCHVANVTTMFYPGQLKLSTLNFLPFAATPRVDWDDLALTRLYLSNEGLKQELAKYNSVYGWHRGSAFYNLFATKPIRKVEDLKGKRVRCASDLGQVLRQFGAVPMTLSSAECYNALQTGLIDTYAHFRDSFHKRRIHEVAKYYIRGMDMGGCASLYIVNKKSWDALPDDLKKIWEEVRDASPPVSQYVYFGAELEAKQHADFKAAGMEFIEFPSEERAKLIEASKSVWAQWVKRNGGTVAQQALDDYIRLGKEVMAKYPNGLPLYKP